VNIRVPVEVYDILEAAAFVRSMRGMQHLLAPLLSEKAKELQEEEAVRAAIAARQSAQRVGTKEQGVTGAENG
jgi:hypothetical protein